MLLSLLRLSREAITNTRHKYNILAWCDFEQKSFFRQRGPLQRAMWRGWIVHKTVGKGSVGWVSSHWWETLSWDPHTQCKLHTVQIAHSEQCKHSFHIIETECTRRNPRDKCFFKNVPLVASLRLIPAFELRHICCGLILQSKFKGRWHN